MPKKDKDKIIVVVKEIESWYLAILDDQKCPKFLNKCCLTNTDNIDKDRFHSLKPDRFDSITDFMLEVIKYPSISRALNRNTSFNYFYAHYCY